MDESLKTGIAVSKVSIYRQTDTHPVTLVRDLKG